jgi:uncharacterized protein YwqG
MSITPKEAIVALQPWIAKHRRTAWRPEILSDNPTLTGSAFSGLPFLLPGEDWPICKSCGVPMESMLQLDLTKLPTDRHGNQVLQLFYCVAGDTCDRGWEAFADYSSLCRTITQNDARPATTNLNRFPAKIIHSWTPIEDLPASAEHERLGIKFDYHFNDVPFQPMELWCPELDLHFVGAEFIKRLEADVAAANGDKLGGWPCWVQGVEYPTCPECGSEMSLLMQIDSEDNVPYMFGDCGVGHITQCPTHHHVVAFAWACS